MLEGAYTRQDFAGLAGLRNVSANLSAAAAVRDSVRQKNLIQTRQVTLKNAEGETYLTAVPVGVINPAAVVLNGKVDTAVNSTTFQLSLPFSLEAEKDYTLLVLDESRNGWLRIKCPESRTSFAYVSNEEGQYAFVGRNLYTVAARDNLWKIAEKQLGNGTRYTEIRQLNGLTCNIIRVGMPLILPEK